MNSGNILLRAYENAVLKGKYIFITNCYINVSNVIKINNILFNIIIIIIVVGVVVHFIANACNRRTKLIVFTAASRFGFGEKFACF